MVKDLNGWSLSQKSRNCKSRIVNVKLTLRENPDPLINNIGTNDVTNEGKPLKTIADSITKFAISLKNESHDVTISNIITRKDRKNAKVDEVNKHRAELSEKNNICLLDNSTPIKSLHLNRSRLYLNRRLLSSMYHIFLNGYPKTSQTK